MLHLVYCPVSGVSTEFEKPDNRIYPRPPGPRGEVARPAGSEHHKQSRVHWTELYPGQTERQYGDRGIFVFLTFLYPYLPLVVGLNYYT